MFRISANDSDGSTSEDVRADELDDSKEWLLLEYLKIIKKYLSRKRYLFFHSLSSLSFLIDYFKCVLFIDLLINTGVGICWTEV